MAWKDQPPPSWNKEESMGGEMMLFQRRFIVWFNFKVKDWLALFHRFQVVELKFHILI
jgi:hypothetical protein